MEEAKRRDHRVIGRRQQLFMFHDCSPGAHLFFQIAALLSVVLTSSSGAPFMLPHGTRIVNRLLSFMRGLYTEYGYDEVQTPVVYSKSLWEQSGVARAGGPSPRCERLAADATVTGHWDHYDDNIFRVSAPPDRDGAAMERDGGRGLKPMNCPAHCLIFASVSRSHRDMPVRLSDFSVLHRNEASGALTGLTRVRQVSACTCRWYCRRLSHAAMAVPPGRRAHLLPAIAAARRD